MMNIKKGFTLIELLIVIAIIGILAGAVVVTLQGNTSDAEEKVANLNVVQTARAVAISESTGTIGEFACPTGVEVPTLDADFTPDEGTTYCVFNNNNSKVQVSGVNQKTWIVFEKIASTSYYCQDDNDGGAEKVTIADANSGEAGEQLGAVQFDDHSCAGAR